MREFYPGFLSTICWSLSEILKRQIVYPGRQMGRFKRLQKALFVYLGESFSTTFLSDPCGLFSYPTCCPYQTFFHCVVDFSATLSALISDSQGAPASVNTQWVQWLVPHFRFLRFPVLVLSSWQTTQEAWGWVYAGEESRSKLGVQWESSWTCRSYLPELGLELVRGWPWGSMRPDGRVDISCSSTGCLHRGLQCAC